MTILLRKYMAYKRKKSEEKEEDKTNIKNKVVITRIKCLKEMNIKN